VCQHTRRVRHSYTHCSIGRLVEQRERLARAENNEETKRPIENDSASNSDQHQLHDIGTAATEISALDASVLNQVVHNAKAASNMPTLEEGMCMCVR